MNWINENSDALMVIITSVYVIATIIIMIANYVSAKASKEQLEESKHQFGESQKQAKAELEESKRQFMVQKKQYDNVERVRIMPYLIAESVETYSRNSRTVFKIALSNQGNGTLLELGMNYRQDPNNLIVYEGAYSYVYGSPFESRFLKVGDRSSVEVIMKDMPTDQKPIDRVYITFKYKDMLDNNYEQKISFLYNDMEVTLINTYRPESSDDVNKP